MWFNFWDADLDDDSDNAWVSWKTIAFSAVLLFGSGYLLGNFAYAVDKVDDAFDDSDDEKIK